MGKGTESTWATPIGLGVNKATRSGTGQGWGSTLSLVWEDGVSSEQTKGICTQAVSMDTRQGKGPIEQRKCLDDTADMTS